jgi:predicted ATPase
VHSLQGYAELAPSFRGFAQTGGERGLCKSGIMETKAEGRKKRPGWTPRLVVLTGGPGAGKTAVLEVVRRHLWEHVAVLPESAGVVFGGGFPRKSTVIGRCAAQRAIFCVQRQLERLGIEESEAGVILCDRGTLDGVAYWPKDSASFFSETETDRDRELARYAAVIHLRTPAAGYNHKNPLRVETPQEAAEIDERIVRAWDGHPRRTFIESTQGFMEKVSRAIALLHAEVAADLAAEGLTR